MSKSYLKPGHAIRRPVVIRSVIIAAVGMFMATMAPGFVFGQQVPLRALQLQEYRKIAPSPLSNADRLRSDIIAATNPETGAVDVRVLRTPDVPGPAWSRGIPSSARVLASPDVAGPAWNTGTSPPVQSLPTPSGQGPSWGGPSVSDRARYIPGQGRLGR